MKEDNQKTRRATTCTSESVAPLVGIAIVNFNGWRDTLECLESVRRLDYPNYLAVVVDNGSADDSMEQIRNWAEERRHEGFVQVEYDVPVSSDGGTEPFERLLRSSSSRDRMVLITAGENRGPTGGANVAIAYALRRLPASDYIFLLDNDAVADAACLSALVTLDREEGPAIIGGTILDADLGTPQLPQQTTPSGFFFSRLIGPGLPVDTKVGWWETANAHGGAMLIPREVLEVAFAFRGRYLYDPFFTEFWEFEFCQLSRRLGFRTLSAGTGSVRHKGERTRRRPFNPIRHYYASRNRILLASAFLPFSWRLLFHLYNIPMATGRVAKALLHRRPDVARAILSGVADGYRGRCGRADVRSR